MSKYNRYVFVKKIYPDYVIFILSKNKLVTYNKDLEIVTLFGLKEFFNLNVSYLILDCLDIKERKNILTNNYFYYFKICVLKEVVNYIFYSHIN